MRIPVRTASPRLLALALSALVPAAAHAAGFDIPENGAVPLARGGLGVSNFGNAYALQFNPAGMSSIDGLDVRIDARFVKHDVTFLRDSTQTTDFDAVSNTAGVFIGPAVEVAYRSPKLLDGRLGIGLGVWGPPGVGKYKYPDPQQLAAQGSESAEVNGRTGQRYGLIDSDILIMYPSIGASYKVSDLLSFGITVQDAIATVTFRQSLAAKSFGGTESSDLDAIVKLQVTQTFKPTGVLGVALTPNEHLRIGASFRPQVAVKGTGTLDIALPAIAAATHTTVEGNGATLALNLPPVARLGATWVGERFNAGAEFTYEGWHVNQKMVLTPDVSIKQGNEPAQKLAPIDIDKKWHDAFGGRLGGSFTALEWEPKKPMLEVHAGALFETNAIPSDYQTIDFVTGDRVGGSLGATFHWKGFALTAGGMLYKPVELQISDSKVARAAAEHEDPPVIVANGKYTSNIWVAAVGLAYSGLGSN